jgi:hypothetical protein
LTQGVTSIKLISGKKEQNSTKRRGEIQWLK